MSTYTKQTWTDTSTQASHTTMSHIEDGIWQAQEDANAAATAAAAATTTANAASTAAAAATAAVAAAPLDERNVYYTSGDYPAQAGSPPAGVKVRHFYGPTPYTGAAWSGVLDVYTYAALT